MAWYLSIVLVVEDLHESLSRVACLAENMVLAIANAVLAYLYVFLYGKWLDEERM